MISYKIKLFFFISLLPLITKASKDWIDDTKSQKWMNYSSKRIDYILKRKLNKNLARNVILLLGDGMGPTTVTAGRILKGQLKGNNGEEEITIMESLDHLALSKVNIKFQNLIISLFIL